MMFTEKKQALIEIPKNTTHCITVFNTFIKN